MLFIVYFVVSFIGYRVDKNLGYYALVGIDARNRDIYISHVTNVRNVMRLALDNLGQGTVLSGALNGRATLSRILQMIDVEPALPQPLFLDFGQIEVATSSYLRECVLALRDLIRGRDSHYYPVVANPNEPVRDELLELTRARSDVLMTCELGENETVKQTSILGELEAKQLLTFNLVQKHGETDAGELMREYGEREKVRHTTAWNNRLSALVGLGLIVELRQGRLKRYRPLFQGV